MKKSLLSISTASAVLLSGSLAFGQTVLVGPDNFSSGTPNSNGYYSYNSNSAGVAWEITSAELVNSNGSAPNTTVFKSFTPTTITLGQSITVNASYRNNQTSTSAGQFELALFDLAAPVTADDFGGTDPRTNQTGLGILQNQFNDRTFGANYTGSGTTNTLSTASTDTTGLYNTLNATNGFTVTQRIDGGGTLIPISLTYSIDSTGLLMAGTLGGNNISYRIDGVTSFTADALYLRGSYGAGTGSRFSRFDDIEVSTIPEPGSFALLGGVLALGLVGLRRRR